MSIEHQAVIVLGLPYEGFSGEFKERIDTELDDGDLLLVQPYLDAKRKDSIVGFVLRSSGDYSWAPFDGGFVTPEEIAAETLKFKAIFGDIEPRIYLSVDVS